MKLIVASMVRNESDRFWRSALDSWKEFADDILILDDASTDDTKAIANRAGAHVFDAEMECLAWGTEAPTRARLWQVVQEYTREQEDEVYALILDADMVPARNPRTMLEARPSAIAFPLFDLWASSSDDPPRLFFRNDEYWQGHLNPRVWCVKVPEEPDVGWTWSERGIHSGHFPLNLRASPVMIAPPEYALLHYAYISEDLRQAKAAQYQSVYDDLGPFERTHAASILDPDPRISPLPFTPEYHLSRP